MPPPAVWTGRLDVSPPTLTIRDDPASDHTATISPYSRKFLQGASLVPRLLFMVDPSPSPDPRVPVRSARSASEKPPWRDLPALAGAVEPAFVHPVHLGETVLPYRLLAPRRAVLPCDARGLLADCHDHPGLAEWWHHAESTWLRHRASDLLTLREQLDYHGKLSVQLPFKNTPRVVYAKSGMYLAAARLDDPTILVDHKLYWSHVAGDDEARYLCAILNAAVTTARVRPLMSYGKDERDIDKFVWRLPIPRYDPTDPEHRTLAALARDVESIITALPLPDAHFTTLRRRIRLTLAAVPAAQRIEQSVARLLARA
jgi:hypothetical protein